MVSPDRSSLYPPEKIQEMREIKRRIEINVIDLNNELKCLPLASCVPPLLHVVPSLSARLTPMAVGT